MSKLAHQTPPTAVDDVDAANKAYADSSGGGGGFVAAAQGDFLHATMGTGHSPAINTPLDIDTVLDSQGDLAVSAAGRFSGLKAGRTYRLLGWGRISTNAAGKTQWRDITGAALIGQQAIHYAVNNTGGVSAQPCALAVIKPTEDTEVELWATDSGMTFSNISTHALIEEIGAVQANVIGGLEFLDIIEVTADQTSVSFGEGGDGAFGRVLDGDVDETYILEGYLPSPGGTGDFEFRPNGLTTNQLGVRHYAGSSHATATGSRLYLAQSNTTPYVQGLRAEFHAKTGKQRAFQCEQFQSDGGSNRHAIQNYGFWSDTTTNVTSIDITSTVASLIRAGARFVLWRRTSSNVRADNASTYERQVGATVSQGTNAEVEYTTGHATYQGSAIGLSASLNDVVTAGSITVNLKVGGVTVLTATLDTTNTIFARDIEAVGIHELALGDEIEVGIATTSLTTTGGGTPGITVNVTLINEALAQPARGSEYIMAGLSGDHTFAVTAIDFDTDLGSKVLTTDSAGKFMTLKAGRTYELTASSQVVIGSGSAEIRYQWYDVTGAVSLGIAGIGRTPTATSPAATQSVAKAIFTPSVDSEVECRMLTGTASAFIESDNSWATIKEIR